MAMEVDIVLPVYRGRRWIREAVDSVLAQTYPRWHLTIVDDASPDDTLDYVKQAYGEGGGRLSLLRLTHRRGPGGARMEAIRQKQGGAIAFIDQDDRWHPQKLAYQVERLQRAPVVEAVHTDIQCIDSYGRRLCGRADRENAKRAYIPSDRLEPEALTRHLFLRADVIRLVSALVRRRPFEQIGGFDETLLGGEDWEFWVRFAASGYHVAHLATSLIERRLHPGNTSRQSVWREGHWCALEKVLRTYPRLTGLATRRKANLLCEEAIAALITGHDAHARQQARQLIRLAPHDWRGSALFLFACLGPIARPLLARRII